MNTYTQTQITHLCSTTYFDPVLNTRILSFFQVNWTDFPWNSSKFLRFEGCLSNVIIQEGERNQRAPFDSESDEHFSEGAAAAGDKAAPRGGGGGATPLPAGGGGGGVARRRGGVHGAEHLPHDVHVAVLARPHLIPQLPQACNHAHDTDQSRRRRRRRRRPNQSKKHGGGGGLWLATYRWFAGGRGGRRGRARHASPAPPPGQAGTTWSSAVRSFDCTPLSALLSFRRRCLSSLVLSLLELVKLSLIYRRSGGGRGCGRGGGRGARTWMEGGLDPSTSRRLLPRVFISFPPRTVTSDGQGYLCTHTGENI